MGKTTIDGLAVRESSNSKRRVQRTRNVVGKIPGGVAGLAAGETARSLTTNPMRKKSTAAAKTARSASSGSASKVAPRAVSKTTAKTMSKAAAMDSFLDPVKSFGSDEEFDGGASLASNNEVDWSDLLSELADDAITNEVVEASDVAEKPASDTSEFVQSVDSGGWLDDWAEKSTDDVLADDFVDKQILNDIEDEESILDKFVDEEKPAKRVKKPRKKMSVRKVVALAMVSILVVGGGALYMWGDGLISRLTGGKSGLFDSLRAMISDEIPFETDANGRTNVLIFGTEGYDMSGTSWGGKHDGAQLTDSIMVASFDQETKDVALLSLPRDLKVSMACSAGKINEVFWCHNQDGNNEEAGAQALMRQISNILGIEFQYYAHVNWGSLVEIVDTLGGITVTLDEDINDYYYTGAVAKAGEPITVNGEQALGLARARHGTAGGDFTRGNTQQKIVEGIAQKVLQNGVGVNEALGLLNILGDNLRSNFSADNIKAAVHLASGINVSSIRQVPLVSYDDGVSYVTTTTINEVSYVVPRAGERNYSEIQKYVTDMFSSDDIKREGAKFAVYNATDEYGVASAEKAKLENDGFEVTRIGDAATEVCDVAYCVYEMSDKKVATRAALEERYGVTVRPESELPEGVWGGDVDFVVVIGVASKEE